MAHAGNPRRAARGGKPPARGAELVSSLSFLASQFTRPARLEKSRLLAALATIPVGDGAHLVRLNQTLCFLQAYPDAGVVVDRVDGLLRELPARIRALGPRGQARLRDTGIAGSTLEYPYGLPMSRWLAARLGASVDIGWEGVEDQEKIAEALDLLVTPSESDAFSEGGFTVRRWLDVARAGRRLTDLQVLIEAFDRAPLDPGMRDWLFDSLGLPVRATFAVPRLSRTGAKRPVERVAFQRGALRRDGIHVAREAVRPLLGMRRASPALAVELIETARAAMATRSRELHAFSHPNAEDVLVADLSPGLRGVLIGLQPEFRLPFEGYYAFLAIRNGVPVGYGGGWCLFETLEFGFNIFESFSARCFVPTITSSGCAPWRSTLTSWAPTISRRFAQARSTSTATSDSSLATRPCGGSWPRRPARSRGTDGTGPRWRSSGGSRATRRVSRCPAGAPSRSAVCGRATWPRWSRGTSPGATAVIGKRLPATRCAG